MSMCVLLGDRYFGLRGALAALAGFLLPAAALVLTLASLFQNYQQLPWVQGALSGWGRRRWHSSSTPQRVWRARCVATASASASRCSASPPWA